MDPQLYILLEVGNPSPLDSAPDGRVQTTDPEFPRPDSLPALASLGDIGWQWGYFRYEGGHLGIAWWHPQPAPEEVPAVLADLIGAPGVMETFEEFGLSPESIRILAQPPIDALGDFAGYGLVDVTGEEMWDQLLDAWDSFGDWPGNFPGLRMSLALRRIGRHAPPARSLGDVLFE